MTRRTVSWLSARRRDMNPRSQIVLCIDDNQDLLDCEKAFLESFGYTVLIAPTGGKGLELAALQAQRSG